jgi:hypothetical protein
MNPLLQTLDSSPIAILQMKLRIDRARRAGNERNVKSLTTRLHLMKIKADKNEEQFPKWRNDNKPASPTIRKLVQKGFQYKTIEIIRPVAWEG